MTVKNETNRLIEVLERIDKSLQKIDAKLNIFVRATPNSRGQVPTYPSRSLDVDTLLSLPDHLRKSAITVAELGEATAEDVSRKTSRTRAAESDYLNQLVTQKLLKKRRKGRDVYFRVEEG